MILELCYTRIHLYQLFWLISDTKVKQLVQKTHYITTNTFFQRDYQVMDQPYFAFQHFTQPNAKCLAVLEGDYSGLVSVVNDQAANYSFDYKGPGQKWLSN